MDFSNLLDLLNKEKRKRDRVKVVRKFAVGTGVVAAIGVAIGLAFVSKGKKVTRKDFKSRALNTVEIIKGTVQKKAETVKDSASHSAQGVGNVINDVQEKMEEYTKFGK